MMLQWRNEAESATPMPRKPKPPNTSLVIERLSEVDEAKLATDALRAKLTFVDDFTGEVREIKPEIATRIHNRVKVIEDYALRVKAARIALENSSREQWERRRKLTEDIINKQFKPQPQHKPFKRRF